MAKVYLDTSFFSVCVTARSTARDVGWRASSNLWWQTQARRFENYISPEVVRELSAADFPNSAPALEMLRGMNVLELSPAVLEFADLLVGERVMPGLSVTRSTLPLRRCTEWTTF